MGLITKWKRRKPGIYWYRTWKHHDPTRTESGYVGKSVNHVLRDADHKGNGRYGHAAKSWAPLIARRYVLRLPWWLGWSWVLLPLETLAILALKPRYNWQKNPWPHKVGPREQMIQAMERMTRPASYRARVAVSRFVNLAVRVAAAVMIVGGVGGYLWTR